MTFLITKTSEILRLQKYLSQAGICSRRKAEEYIERGLVTVNGEKAKIGQSVNLAEDKIVINNTVIQEISEFVYYKLNKPRDIISTCRQD
jgi:16S rRNA U516 pseudouridylate synthase RsuA-like enzyme